MPRLLLLSSLCLTGLLLSGTVEAQDSIKFVQVETIQDADFALLKKLEAALAKNAMDDVTVYIDELLSRSKGENANLLVPINGSDEKAATRHRGFRDLILGRLLELPMKVREQIARGHNAAVRGLLKRRSKQGPLNEEALLEIVESYPLAAKARMAAERLAELSFERDDLVAALHYDRFIDQFHLFAALSWSSHARRCLTAARTDQIKRAQSAIRIFRKKVEETKRKDLIAFSEQTAQAVKYIFAQKKVKLGTSAKIPGKVVLLNPKPKNSKIAFWQTKKKPDTRAKATRNNVFIWRNGQRIPNTETMMLSEPPRFHPFIRGNYIYVSNGRRVFAHSAKTGKRKAILPFHLGETVADPPPPGMETQVVGFGSLLLSNLYIPRSSPSLSRNRVLYGQGFGNNYGSLFLFDADRGHKIVFWEGDRGPGQKGKESIEQPEEDDSSYKRSLASLMANGHILGRPAICGQRLYAALLVSDGEPEIWLAAFERGDRSGDDLGLGLQPAWATFVGTVSANLDKSIPAVFPSVTVSKDLVFVDSGTATLACISAFDGSMKWVTQTATKKKAQPRGRNRAFQTRGNVNPPSLDPIRFVNRPGLSDLALIAPAGKNEVTAFDTKTGRIAWSTRHQKVKANRFFVTEDGLVIRYGNRVLMALDGRNGKLASDPVEGSYNLLNPNENVSFRGDVEGPRIVLPTGKGYARIIDFKVERRGKFNSFDVAFTPRKAIKLIGTKDDGHIVFTSHGLAYASKSNLYIYGPEAPAEEKKEKVEKKPKK
jgi:hypothetical protein